MMLNDGTAGSCPGNEAKPTVMQGIPCRIIYLHGETAAEAKRRAAWLEEHYAPKGPATGFDASRDIPKGAQLVYHARETSEQGKARGDYLRAAIQALMVRMGN